MDNNHQNEMVLISNDRLRSAFQTIDTRKLNTTQADMENVYASLSGALIMKEEIVDPTDATLLPISLIKESGRIKPIPPVQALQIIRERLSKGMELGKELAGQVEMVQIPEDRLREIFMSLDINEVRATDQMIYNVGNLLEGPIVPENTINPNEIISIPADVFKSVLRFCGVNEYGRALALYRDKLSDAIQQNKDVSLSEKVSFGK